MSPSLTGEALAHALAVALADALPSDIEVRATGNSVVLITEGGVVSGGARLASPPVNGRPDEIVGALIIALDELQDDVVHVTGNACPPLEDGHSPTPWVRLTPRAIEWGYGRAVVLRPFAQVSCRKGWRITERGPHGFRGWIARNPALAFCEFRPAASEIRAPVEPYAQRVFALDSSMAKSTRGRGHGESPRP